MEKRTISVFCIIMLLMTSLIYRIYYIDMSSSLSKAASVQGNYRLDIVKSRGNIYDKALNPLVNQEHDYTAAVLPSPKAATVLLNAVPEDAKAVLMEKLTSAMPFVMSVENNNIYAQGVDVFARPIRYSANQIATHLIGYLSGANNKGVAGIEKSFDLLLENEGEKIWGLYQINAAGQALQGGKIDIHRSVGNGSGGVVLTIDEDIQAITEYALASNWDKGAAVVLDIASGDILAMASLPVFDPNNISASLDSTDAPFINRAISGYNIGSVFKLVVAAAALENKIPRSFEYECKGFVDIDGQIFRCNNNAVHGITDMERALEVSCNTYFINLSQKLGASNILPLCKHLGFGAITELAPQLNTQSGNLPTSFDLDNSAALANFSFGQGSSLATPLQMARVVATIAGDGNAVIPRLVKGVTLDGKVLSEQTPIYASNQVLSAQTCKTLSELMCLVVEEGSGKTAKPIKNGAGGKTSSAQTGQFVDDKEIVHAWFAGYYPAKNPKYSIVVFCENGESGEKIAAPIFKQIVDNIASLDIS